MKVLSSLILSVCVAGCGGRVVDTSPIDPSPIDKPSIEHDGSPTSVAHATDAGRDLSVVEAPTARPDAGSDAKDCSAPCNDDVPPVPCAPDAACAAGFCLNGTCRGLPSHQCIDVCMPYQGDGAITGFPNCVLGPGLGTTTWCDFQAMTCWCPPQQPNGFCAPNGCTDFFNYRDAAPRR